MVVGFLTEPNKRCTSKTSFESTREGQGAALKPPRPRRLAQPLLYEQNWSRDPLCG